MADSKVTIETGVDQLVKYLKYHKATSVNELAQVLNTTPQTIQSWAEFLIEEKIVGIEYKLTTPYLFLIENEKSKDLNDFKREFQYEGGEDLSIKEYNWKNYIMNIIETHKNFFVKEAKKRHLYNTDELWEKYKKRVAEL